MDCQTVLYEQEGAVVCLTLNRPEKLNAMNAQLRDDLDSALREADRGAEVRVIVLRAAGRAFRAGYGITPQTRSMAATIAHDRDRLRKRIERRLAIGTAASRSSPRCTASALRAVVSWPAYAT